ncbi:uncharacterized protein LOC116801458 isoform X2 [Drosophila sechellia]|uniref:uncharacterized protein LOC116801458 isoform X2 n=1 Tax=Drosophila sechellia TaxID=7238 RepID=UPI0013DE5D95|nr:uncharacterized protein LOC116801458 isoform X2 [Drosophila sechellia]
MILALMALNPNRHPPTARCAPHRIRRICHSQSQAVTVQRSVHPTGQAGWIKVWQLFAVILDKSGADIEVFVACRNCYNVHKFQMSISSLMKHKCAMQLDVPNHNSEWKPDIYIKAC